MNNKKSILLIILFLFSFSFPSFSILAQSSLSRENIDQVITQVQILTEESQNLNKNISSLRARRLTKEASDLTSNLTKILRQRKALLLKLAEKDPRRFLALAMREKERRLFPRDAQLYIEEETTLTGKIEVIHIDDFQNPQNSEFRYFLRRRANREKINLYPTIPLNLRSGTNVRVKGFLLEKAIVADINRTNFQVLEEAPPPESVGDQKTLVLLINFTNSGPIPFTKEEAVKLVFEGQFQNFMKEQSYNQVSFSGDVYGWFNLNKTADDECLSVSDEDRDRIITENNINLENYSRIVYLVNLPSLGGCSFVGKVDIPFKGKNIRLSQAFIGLGEFNQPSVWGRHPFQWTNLDLLLSHELGHSLGLLHANGWDCGDQVIYGDNCRHIEYGNLFDAMADGRYSLHFNAFYKELLGWLKPSDVQTINSSGRYTIYPLETPFGTPKLIKIVHPVLKKPFYFLEHRREIGFDQKLNHTQLSSNQFGLFVNMIVPEYSNFFSRLLDMTPTSLDWGDDIMATTLNSENTFTDADSGITIGGVSYKAEEGYASSSISFYVQFGDPVCLSREPKIEIGLPSDFGLITTAVSGQGHIPITVTNMDSFLCGNSNFTGRLISPAWRHNFVYSPSPFILAPDAVGYVDLDFFVPEDTSPGEYLLKFEVTNLRSGLKTEKEVTINVVPRPVITKIEPQSGQIGAKITIFGSGFSTDDKNPNFIEFLSPQNGVSFMLKAVSNDGQTLEVAIPQNYCEKGFVGDCGTAEVFPVIPGRYKIYVSAYGAISNSEEFIIKEETPTISLSAMPTQGQAPLSVTFTATLENFRDKCNTLVWYFGDGNTQEQSICTTTATTTHTYNNAGAFGAKVNINKISSNLVTIDVKSPPGVWIKKTDFKGGSRSDAVGFAIGNKGYIGLGRDRINRTYKNDFWEYDPINGTWTQKADFPGTPRCCAVGFSIGNKGYVGTGVSNLPLKDFWEYDPLENKWIRKADFRGGERFGAVGFAIGNKGYVGLGSSLIYHNDFWEFNPSVGTLGTWTQKADFPGTPRCCAVGFSIGNKGYVGTGVGGTSNILLKDFWEFNPIFNQWVRKADFEGGAMQKAVGFSIGDKGYVGLGRIPGSAKLKTDFWEYNSLSDQWIQKTSFPGNPGCCAVGFSIGNKGYVGLERDSSYQSINDFWEFDPTAIPEKGFKRINDLMASILEIISQIVDEINKLIEK